MRLAKNEQKNKMMTKKQKQNDDKKQRGLCNYAIHACTDLRRVHLGRPLPVAGNDQETIAQPKRASHLRSFFRRWRDYLRQRLGLRQHRRQGETKRR